MEDKQPLDAVIVWALTNAWKMAHKQYNLIEGDHCHDSNSAAYQAGNSFYYTMDEFFKTYKKKQSYGTDDVDDIDPNEGPF